MDLNEKINKLGEIIENSDNIVFFGGAGVSTESGIPDFRSADGIYNQKTKNVLSPEEIVSHTYFMNHTEEFYNFYRENFIFENAEPNNCHIGLKKLEDEGKLKAIITQNIDGLHQKAGSENVLELHGNVYRNYCTQCGKSYNIKVIIDREGIPRCECGGIIKPDVVLYEEPLNGEIMNSSISYIANCETLIIGGTSLVVNPASSLIQFFNGKNLILINKSETPYDYMAQLVINHSIGEIFSKVLNI